MSFPVSSSDPSLAPDRPAAGTAPADDRRQRFVAAHTDLAAPPHVPEVRLHLATEAHDLWHRTEEELAREGLPPPFWAFAWAGGQGLARHVLDHPASIRNRRVLDFASGSGLVAIAAARAGAARVLAADPDLFAEAAAGLNAAANGVAFSFETRDIVGEMPDCDVVLAGDVFYDRPFAARLVPWFDRLRAAGIEILVGDPGRAYLPRERVEALSVHEVAVTRALEDAEVKRTTVWRWRGP